MLVKHKKEKYYFQWNYVRRKNQPPVTHCFVKDDEGLLAHAEVVLGEEDSFSRKYGRKRSLRRVIQKAIPRINIELRKKIWNKYRKMTKKWRW